MLRGLPRALAGLALALLVATPASAHDYWLEAQRYHLAPGEALRVDLVVGEHLHAHEPRPYQPERTERFELIRGDGVIDLRATTPAGASPVIDGRPVDGAGPALVAMERGWAEIALPDQRFSDYLGHEGLAAIEAQRDRQGHREVERERYRRSVKALIQVGAGGSSAAVHRRVLGHPLELVVLDDPYARRVGDRLRVRVLFQGKPLRRAWVTAHVRDAKGEVTTLRVRTGLRGIARLRVDRPGVWLVRLVHMRACEGCESFDWESYWASYSFAVAGG